MYDWRGIEVAERGSLDLYKTVVAYAAVLSGSGDFDQDNQAYPAMTRINASVVHGGLYAYSSGRTTDVLSITNSVVLGNLYVESFGAPRVSNTTAKQMHITGFPLLPSLLTGNKVTGHPDASISLSGRLGEDWTWPTSGTPFTIRTINAVVGLQIQTGVTLTIPPGAVIKFWPRYFEEPELAPGLYGTVVSTATPEDPAILTSIYDDSVGGDTNGDGGATQPSEGD